MTTPLDESAGGGYGLPPVDFTVGPVPIVVSAKAITASQQLTTIPGMITSVDGNETTGAAAFLAYLHDGTDATGPIVAAIGAPSGSGENASPAPPGIPVRNGIYVERVSGTFTIVVVLVPELTPLPY